MPSFEELCARYGDPAGRKVYMLPRDLEQKWMDMHERETGIKFLPTDATAMLQSNNAGQGCPWRLLRAANKEYCCEMHPRDIS